MSQLDFTSILTTVLIRPHLSMYNFESVYFNLDHSL